MTSLQAKTSTPRSTVKAAGEAKPSKAPKVAASPVKAPRHGSNVALAAIREAFEAREGSKRGTLLATLAEKQGKQVALPTILKALYGSADEGRAKLTMVLRGLQASIDKDKLPFAIHKAKNEASGEATFGLYHTKR